MWARRSSVAANARAVDDVEVKVTVFLAAHGGKLALVASGLYVGALRRSEVGQRFCWFDFGL